MLFGMAASGKPTFNQAFGIAIKRFRAKRALTQEEVAHGASVSLTSLARMETGQHGVRLETALRLAESLGISGATLVGECERILAKSGGASK